MSFKFVDPESPNPGFERLPSNAQPDCCSERTGYSPLRGCQSGLDPLSLVSILMWMVYAATLSGRAIGAWRGRRAAYFAIIGFGALLASLGAGALFHGRHGA